MDEKNIKKLVNDPNAWAWDGCTYPEWETNTSNLDAVVEKLFKAADEAYKTDKQKN